ncbi:MAG: hypothetical protein AAF740_11935, partial [Bacteroidota bacterium]
MTTKLFLLLSAYLFSCQEAPREKQHEVEIGKQVQVSVTDSVFRFKGKVLTIFQDSKGSYWIGSKENGLCKYDGGVYTYFTTKDGLASNAVPYIQEDQSGNIWLNNGENITQFDGEQFVVINKNSIPNADKFPTKLSSSDLWFRDQSKAGIFRYDGRNLTYISFESPPLNLRARQSHFFVSGITNVVNNQIWFGTIMQGAVGIEEGRVSKIDDESIDFHSVEEFFHIRSMLLDKKGNLWMGNNGIGVIVRRGDSLVNFSKEHRQLLPMSDFERNTNTRDFASNTGLQAVFAIEEDQKGNIWFGDRDSGVWKYDGDSLYNYTSIYREDSIDELVWDIYNDQNDVLYFILVNGDVFTFDGASFIEFDGF